MCRYIPGPLENIQMPHPWEYGLVNEEAVVLANPQKKPQRAAILNAVRRDAVRLHVLVSSPPECSSGHLYLRIPVSTSTCLVFEVICFDFRIVVLP